MSSALAPPRPNRNAPPVPLPALLRPERDTSQGNAGLLYRIYLVVLLGGIYGYALIRAILDTPTVAFTGNELVVLGLAATVLPFVATTMGAGIAERTGVVPIARAEAAVLLPTPIDRREIVVPRLTRMLFVVTAAGVGAGVLAMALLALQRTVGGGAVVLPLLVACMAALGVGWAARSQSHRGGAYKRQRRYVSWLALAIVVLSATAGPGRTGFAALGRSVVGIDPPWAALALFAVVAAGAVFAVMTGRSSLADAHTEALASRAGLHDGVAASASLGSLRSIAALQSLDGRPRRQSWPYPRRPSGVVRWRYLTTLRAKPAPLLLCLAGWSLATWLLTLSTSGPADVVLRVFLAAGALYVGSAPMLEPLRREHDTPLASELFPFGFARLTRLHLQAALLIITPVGLVGVGATWMLTGRPFPLLAMAGATLAAALTVVIALGDRVRKTTSLGGVLASLPVGAPPETLGITLAAKLLWPLTSLLPVALPVGVMLSAPYLDVSAAPLVVFAAVAGALLLGGRIVGLTVWLGEYEQTLRNADLLGPSGVFTLVWQKLQDRRYARLNAKSAAEPQ